MRVSARGPVEVDFERTGSAEQGALFTTAGSYLVCATLCGRLLAGAPPWSCLALNHTIGREVCTSLDLLLTLSCMMCSGRVILCAVANALLLA